MKRAQLIEVLVRWRQAVHGSISPENHRRLLGTRSTPYLTKVYDRIAEREKTTPPSERFPALLERITKEVLGE